MSAHLHFLMDWADAKGVATEGSDSLHRRAFCKRLNHGARNPAVHSGFWSGWSSRTKGHMRADANAHVTQIKESEIP